MTPEQLKMAYKALLKVDEATLQPGASWKEQCELNRALDCLRQELIARLEDSGIIMY